jgi:hypothetical protein
VACHATRQAAIILFAFTEVAPRAPLVRARDFRKRIILKIEFSQLEEILASSEI